MSVNIRALGTEIEGKRTGSVATTESAGPRRECEGSEPILVSQKTSNERTVAKMMEQLLLDLLLLLCVSAHPPLLLAL